MNIRTITLATLFSAALIAPGCSSDESDPSAACGAGTALQGGKCVPVTECGEGTVNVDGKCVAGGAGSAGSSSGGASGSSGGAGSAGSSGGAAGQGGAGGGNAGSAGAAGSGGASGMAGSGGMSGSAGAAGSGGASMWTDDPCTLDGKQFYYNGDPNCGQMNAVGYCSAGNLGHPAPIKIGSTWDGSRFYIRTPSHPGNHPECKQQCTPDGTVYSIDIPFGKNLNTAAKERITVWHEGKEASPWKFQWYLSPSAGCDFGNTFEDCTFNLQPATLHIYTDDPNAPAREFRVEIKKHSETPCNLLTD